ncbi:MAG TPA: LOG family protein [Candidatus Saccharimonadales bacterium]|nr:LOG family protein [Candidatus Saccharimonadales bacterium]
MDINTKQIINSVTFFGCACGEPGEPNYEAAKAVAKEVALSGRRVINGGGPGTMLAATLGAKEGEGKTTVVYYRPELATSFKGEIAANYAEEHYEESNYILRTKKLLELGNAYIIFNGGTGTISEFAMAWGVARLYFGHHKPLILYGDFWHSIMDNFKKNMFVREEEYKVFTIVNTPEDAIRQLDAYEKIVDKNRKEHRNCASPGAECHLLL